MSPSRARQDVMELVADGASLAQSLQSIVGMIEGEAPEMLCSILLAHPAGNHLTSAATSVSLVSWASTVGDVPIAPGVGTCGTAAHTKQRVVVGNIATDPLCTQYREIALQHGLKAGWSQPVMGQDGKLLGTMALYYREPRMPADEEFELVNSAAWLASMAIELAHARKDLHKNVERFQYLMRATNDVIWDWDMKADLLWWNEAFYGQFGYAKENVEPGNESWTSRIHPEDRDGILQSVHEILDAGADTWSGEYRFRCQDGRYVPIFDRAFVLRNAAGVATRMFGSMQDTSARKEAEAALREAEGRYRQLSDQCPDPMLVLQDEKLVYANQAATRLFGARDAAELLGRTAIDFVHPDYRELVRGRQRLQRESNRAAPVAELIYQRLDGTAVEVEVSSAPFQFHGRYALQVIARDITERKKAERSLTELQERYRQLVELSPDAIHIHQDGRLVFVNSACVRLFGATSADQLLNRPLLDFIHPDQRDVVRGRMRYLYEEQKKLPGMQQRLLRVDGAVIDADINAAPFTFEGRAAVQTVIRDISDRVLAEDALWRFRTAMDLSPDFIALIDPQRMRFIDINDTACSMLGYSRDELLEMGPQDVGSLSREEVQRAYLQILEGDPGQPTLLTQFRRKDGGVVPVELVRRAVHGRSGNVIVTIARDVTEKQKAEAQAHKAAEQTRNILSSISDAFVAVDKDWKYTYMNATAERQLRRSRDEMMGHVVWEEFPEAVGTIFESQFQKAIAEKVAVEFEAYFAPLEVWWEVHAYPYDDGLSIYFRDVTDRKRTQERLSWLAQYDPLTGLPNRALFLDRLRQAVARGRRERQFVAVMFLDLDRFKEINDSLGHAAGDEVLREVSERLKQHLRDVDTISRLGGDEFTILVEGFDNPQHVMSVAEKILYALAGPIDASGHEVYVTASIGIAIASAELEDPDQLLKGADIAMYHAKQEGRNNYQVYSDAMHAHSSQKLNLEARLRRALERDEFRLVYQPRISIRTGRIVGAEALIRWHSADLGTITPNRFIPVAEETGLIVPIGEWVLRAACARSRAWQEAGLPPLAISVNLSPRQFRRKDLLDSVLTILEETGVAADRLELEITEGTVMHRPDEAAAMLKMLSQAGVGVSIDDFGTGYSSLSYLKRLPVHALKIDQSFMRDVSTDSDDAAIVRAIVGMAHSLGLRVVAEGVETPQQLAFLQKLGCDEAQGYLFSKPVPEEALREQLAASAVLAPPDRGAGHGGSARRPGARKTHAGKRANSPRSTEAGKSTRQRGSARSRTKASD